MGQLFSYFQAAPASAEEEVSDPPVDVAEEGENDRESACSDVIGDSDEEETPEEEETAEV